MTACAIEVEDIEFAWKAAAPVLAVSHFSVARGERVFLQGASGSGKSTLLGIIGGILKPRTGQVRVLGAALSELKAAERDRFRGEHIGVHLPDVQSPTVLECAGECSAPARFFPGPRAANPNGDASQEVLRLLGALGLSAEGMVNRRVTDLSMGQQQRVAAARALIGTPQLLIADEPTSSLDTDARGHFLELLMSQCAAHGTTLLFVSHDATLAGMFDRTVHLRDINAISADPA